MPMCDVWIVTYRLAGDAHLDNCGNLTSDTNTCGVFTTYEQAHAARNALLDKAHAFGERLLVWINGRILNTANIL